MQKNVLTNKKILIGITSNALAEENLLLNTYNENYSINCREISLFKYSHILFYKRKAVLPLLMKIKKALWPGTVGEAWLKLFF